MKAQSKLGATPAQQAKLEELLDEMDVSIYEILEEATMDFEDNWIVAYVPNEVVKDMLTILQERKRASA
jgi:hypothetical protein